MIILEVNGLNFYCLTFAKYDSDDTLLAPGWEWHKGVSHRQCIFASHITLTGQGELASLVMTLELSIMKSTADVMFSVVT